jgi:hypothetical protein
MLTEYGVDPNGTNTNQVDSIPPLKALSLLDRFLILWIVLAMAIGILLGNFVPSTGPSLQKGELVGVSLPIGKFRPLARIAAKSRSMTNASPPLPNLQPSASS